MKPRRRTRKLVIRNLEDETLVYDLESHAAHRLNRTAALVFELADGERSKVQIAAAVSKRLEIPEAGPLVGFALEQLARAHLLDGSTPARRGRPPLTRRSLLKQAGVLAALLPVVATIMAPNAMAAASYITVGACNLRQNAGCVTGVRKCSGSFPNKYCKSTKKNAPCACL